MKADSAEWFTKYGRLDIYLGHAYFIYTKQFFVNYKVLKFF